MSRVVQNILTVVKDDLGIKDRESDKALTAHVRMAMRAIGEIRRYDNDERDFEDKYVSTAVGMTLYTWNKRGFDGALTMSESGVGRGYEAGNYPPSYTRFITPRVV